MNAVTLDAVELASLWNSEHLMLLLDGGVIDNVGTQLQSMDPFAQRRWTYEDTEYARDQQRGPLLVECNPQSAALSCFLQTWSAQHAGLLIGGNGGLPALTAHWRNLRHAVLPDGKLSLFRPYDPRRLRGLLAAMQPHECDSLLGPSNWMVWRECHAGQDIWYRVSRNDAVAASPQLQPWQITPAQLAALASGTEAAYLEALTLDLLARVPGLDGLSASEASREVWHMAEDARNLGYVHAGDMGEYIELMFCHNKRCVAPGPLNRLITDTRLPAWRRLEGARQLLNQDVDA